MKIVVLDGYTENPGDLSWDQLSCMGELTVYGASRRCHNALRESPLLPLTM